MKKNNTILKFFLLFLGIYCIILLISVAWKTELRLFNINDYFDEYEAQIYSVKGFDNSGNRYYSIEDDPNIIIYLKNPGDIAVNLVFDEDSAQSGSVYYSDTPYGFSEERVFLYEFKEGDNNITIDDVNASYVRLDITNQTGVGFAVNGVKVSSHLKGLLCNINPYYYIIIALLAAVLFSFVRQIEDEKKRINYFFWILLILSLYIIFGEFIIGEQYYMYEDIGSDTVNQYYPFYINEVLKIRTGEFSIWNWDYGLGASSISTNLWITDPFGIPVVLLGVVFGPGVVHLSLVWVQILKIITVYVLGKKYFSLLLKSNLAVNISAFVLALNGYLLLWGQHYFMGTALVFFVLLLWEIERNFHRQLWGKISFSILFTVALILLNSYYFGYMILISGGIYYLVRFFSVNKEKNVKIILTRLLACVASVLIGMMLSAVLLIPSIYSLLSNSDRVSGVGNGILSGLWQSFISSFDIWDIGVRLTRMLSNSITLDRSFINYYEDPELFVSGFLLFFIGFWLVSEWKKSRAENRLIIFWIKVVLVVLLVFSAATGFIMTGFAGVSYRYTYIAMPIFCFCIGYAFDKFEEKDDLGFWGIEVGSFLTIIAISFSFYYCSEESVSYLIYICILLLVGRFLLLLLLRAAREKRKVLVHVILLCVIISTVVDGYVTTNNRDVVTDDEYVLDWNVGLLNDTTEALKWIDENEDGFYRVDKQYVDWKMYGDSFIERYSGLTWYNSTQNKNIISFYKNIYNEAYDVFPSLFCFRNETELGLRAAEIADVEYVLTRNEISDTNYEKVKQFGNVSVYNNKNTDSIAKWFTNTISKTEFEMLEDEKKVEILSDSVVVDDERCMSYESSEADIGVFDLVSQTELKGHVDCTDDGILFLAIPDWEGWEIFDNGSLVDSINADYGFLGVNLGEGKHDIRISYHIPHLTTGIIISTTALLIIIAVLLFQTIRKRKNRG